MCNDLVGELVEDAVVVALVDVALRFLCLELELFA